MTRLAAAFRLFDVYNEQDPNKMVWNKISYPVEYFFALQVHNWITILYPNASEALLLASRSQHIGRWTSARTGYPEGKAGYLKWRLNLAKFHAAKASELMQQAGYETDIINKVSHIILKKNLKKDHEVQAMENALCLVFLQFQYEEFIYKHEEQKLIRILQKSWAKMSQPGRDAALTIGYSEKGKALFQKALA
jgi:hypothetical protein